MFATTLHIFGLEGVFLMCKLTRQKKKSHTVHLKSLTDLTSNYILNFNDPVTLSVFSNKMYIKQTSGPSIFWDYYNKVATFN